MGSKEISVVLIEDSALMRLVVSDMVKIDPSIKIVATANNGKDGVAAVKKHQPDVVVTDIVMPNYDGKYVVKRIMKEIPTPILVLSSIGTSDPQAVFDTMDLGAHDFLDKPHGRTPSKVRSVEKLLVAKIKEAAQVEIEQLLLKRKKEKKNSFYHSFKGKLNYDIICIGSSTGGPNALEKVIKKLPGNLSIPVVIAQHMPQRFIPSFARRLNSLTSLTVKVAEKGEPLIGGFVYLGQGHANFKIQQDSISNRVVVGFTKKRFKEFNDPSVDCLMHSVAEVYKGRVIGIILTGMGKDGTLGMEAIYKKGGYTIAQDERSCVVFGMPKSAIGSGYVRQVVQLKDIPSFVISCLN